MDENCGMLVQALDVALDTIADELDAGNSDQARQLVSAAQQLVDQVLEAMGIPDADDDAQPESAVRSALWAIRYSC